MKEEGAGFPFRAACGGHEQACYFEPRAVSVLLRAVRYRHKENVSCCFVPLRRKKSRTFGTPREAEAI